MHRLTLAAAAALVLAAGACAKDPGAEAEKADPGSRSGAKGKSLSWWQRLSQGHREPREKPWVYGDVRPGKGLLSDDEHGFTLLRKGEGQSSDPTKPAKPAKVRR